MEGVDVVPGACPGFLRPVVVGVVEAPTACPVRGADLLDFLDRVDFIVPLVDVLVDLTPSDLFDVDEGLFFMADFRDPFLLVVLAGCEGFRGGVLFLASREEGFGFDCDGYVEHWRE